MKNGIKKIVSAALAGLMCLGGAALASCGNSNEKNITVVVREQGSGTREAFDKVVTDGTHFLEEKDSAGKKVYNTASTAVQQTKTGTVLPTATLPRPLRVWPISPCPEMANSTMCCSSCADAPDVHICMRTFRQPTVSSVPVRTKRIMPHSASPRFVCIKL